MKTIKRALCLTLTVCLVLLALTSCGNDASVYAKDRDVTGRDISYAKITVKDYGEIVVLLDATTAPKTVANFKKLVSEGFYNGLTFHRVIKDFMIQGGDPEGNGTGDSQNKVQGEFSSNGHANDILHLRGVISMARGNDVNSASCQFFICNADSPHLDGNYAAFGYVVDGMKVVDKITKNTWYLGDDPDNGGGVIRNKAQQPVIESIVLLDSYK
jgi:peptidyl-prolyl cis-trans isomerase B (cyclophilin B)